MSANLLTVLGIPYVSEGGSFLCKLHPGTYLLLLSFAILAFQRGGWSVIASQNTLMIFLGLQMACLFYSLFMTGTANLVVQLDTFLPAGLFAFILSKGQPRDQLNLRLIMQLLIAANAAMALVETMAHSSLIPLYLNDLPYHSHDEDFRPTALFDHPLTGSVMMMLGLAIVPQRFWLKMIYLGLIWAALLAYGGRMAVGITLLVTCSAAVIRTGDALLRRNPQATNRVVAAALVVAGMLLLTAASTGIGLGTRLAGHLYWDDSAQVRLAQWQVLYHLTGWQLLFGTTRADFLALLVPLRLGTGVEVIENFWLLMFVSLGLFGFPLFFGALSALLAWCWRRSMLKGRLLLLSVLLVASTSNSIGRKSTILVCLVSAIACMPVRPGMNIRQAAQQIDNYRLATT